MMILVRLWLILSLSRAAPLNPKVDKETKEEDLVTVDIPNVDIVNGFGVVSDGIQSQTSQNTIRDAKHVFHGGDITFGDITFSDMSFSDMSLSVGNNAQIYIGSSIGASQDPHPQDHHHHHHPQDHHHHHDPQDHHHHHHPQDPFSVDRNAVEHPVCTGDAVNLDACFCGNGQGGGETCTAGQGCNPDGTCLNVCTKDAVNQDACFCNHNHNDLRGEACTAGQGCNSDGCLKVCSVDAVNTDPCFCKNGQGGGQDCDAEQGCTSDGACLDVCATDAVNYDACFCKNAQGGGKDCTAGQGCNSAGTCLNGKMTIPCRFEDKELEGPTDRSHHDPAYDWNNNIIPYIFTSTSDSDKQLFRNIMDIIEEKTCFEFQEKTEADDINQKFLEIETESESCETSCRGYVKYHKETKRIKLTSSTQVSDKENCKKQCQGFILHELMHALGVAHTFTRTDRDKFITVNKANVEKIEADLLFKKCENCVLFPEIPYDCNSIMHYGTHISGIEVMTPKDANACSLKREAKLVHGPTGSDLDWKLLNIIGKCSGRPVEDKDEKDHTNRLGDSEDREQGSQSTTTAPSSAKATIASTAAKTTTASTTASTGSQTATAPSSAKATTATTASTAAKATTASTTASTGHLPAVCSSADPPFIPHLTDCSSYYQCSPGHAPVKYKCAGTTRWNAKINNCDFDYNVPCPSGRPVEDKDEKDHVNRLGDSEDREQGDVSCGEHRASSCFWCPQGHGEIWCNGDCNWTGGKCIRGKVSCGNHRASSCYECPQGHRETWCNGECSWTGTKCIGKSGVATKTPTMETTNCVCGQVGKMSEDRVQGGEDAKRHEFPWMVQLKVVSNSLKLCGGSLINDRWIVTAAHCFKEYADRPNEVKVILGEHDRYAKDDTTWTIELDVEKIIRHPKYIGTTYDKSNDIALWKLKSRVDINNYVPVCLPNQNNVYTGKKATVAGWGATRWGATSAGSSNSGILQKLEIPVVSDDKCKKAMENKQRKITADMLCAGGEKNEDSCQGDSGGPLIYKNEDQKYELIGVVSWGDRCGLEGKYGVYAKTSAFIKWINEVIENNGGGEYCGH